jgi:chromosome segregation ATPase
MPEYLNGLDQLEKEIANYRSKFQESYEVLDDLAKVKLEFAGFSQKYQELDENYQKLAEYIKEAKSTLKNLQTDSKTQVERLTQAEQQLNERFNILEKNILENIQQNQGNYDEQLAKLEQRIDQRWEKFRAAIELQNQEQTGEFDSLLEIAVKNWDNRFRDFQSALDKIDKKLEVTTGLIQEVKQNTKQQLAAAQLRVNQTEESISQINQRINETETAVYIVSGIGCVLAALLALLPFWLQRNSDFMYRQGQPQITNPR